MTAQTIGLMRQYACEDSQSSIVRKAALLATKGNESSKACAVKIHQWIRQRVRFQTDEETAASFCDDPAQAEVLIRPVDILTMPEPAGDCDDFSMLCAAMLQAVGIRACFTTVAADAAEPNVYSHVYVKAQVEDGWLSLDCSHGSYAGWEVTPKGKKKTWPLRMIDMVRTLSGYDPVDGTYTPDVTPAPPADTSSTTINLPWFGSGATTPAPGIQTGTPWYAPSTPAPASPGQVFDLNSLVGSLVKTTGGILTAQFGVPQVPTGTYITGPNGTIYRQPAGSASLNPVPFSSSLPSSLTSGGSSLLFMGALALGAVLLISAMGKK
jgi:hypothetical protein